MLQSTRQVHFIPFIIASKLKRRPHRFANCPWKIFRIPPKHRGKNAQAFLCLSLCRFVSCLDSPFAGEFSTRRYREYGLDRSVWKRWREEGWKMWKGTSREYGMSTQMDHRLERHPSPPRIFGLLSSLQLHGMSSCAMLMTEQIKSRILLLVKR